MIFNRWDSGNSGPLIGPKRLSTELSGQLSGSREQKFRENKEMTGDGAKNQGVEKTVFWAVATPL
jgi:hypothetical protein